MNGELHAPLLSKVYIFIKFMDQIKRFDVLLTEVLWMVNIGQKYPKGA